MNEISVSMMLENINFKQILTALFITLLCFYCHLSYANQNKIEEAYISVLNILHGEAIPVTPTDHYCDVIGKQTISTYEVGSTEWYNNIGSCVVSYVPNLKSISTPLSHAGMIEHFFFDKKKRDKLMIALNTLNDNLNPEVLENLNLLRKIEIQLTFWEVTIALEWRRKLKLEWSDQIDSLAMDVLQVLVNEILHKVLLNGEEVEKIPNNLGDIPNYPGFEEFKPVVDKIVNHSSEVFEDNYPTVVHSEVTGKRLSERIFITSENKLSLQRLQEFFSARSRLLDPYYVPNLGLIDFDWLDAEGIQGILKTDSYLELKKYLSPHSGKIGGVKEFAYLNRWLPDLKTILVTYINVLDKNLRIHETDLVHSWREIEYKGVVDIEDSFQTIEDNIHITAFDYEKNLNFGISELKPNYKIISDAELVRFGINNVSPAVEVELPLTSTNKANCVRCHFRSVQTFSVRVLRSGWPKSLSFSPPLTRSTGQTKYYQEEKMAVELKLKEISNKYLSLD